jgi:succinyl-CoA synthetase beta subunit
MKQQGGFNFEKRMQDKLSKLQTQPADTFHEHQVRKALKNAGLSDQTVGKVIQNLHEQEDK